MISVCTARPARGGRLCEHFSGYKTINRIPLLRVVTFVPINSCTPLVDFVYISIIFVFATIDLRLVNITLFAYKCISS